MAVVVAYQIDFMAAGNEEQFRVIESKFEELVQKYDDSGIESPATTKLDDKYFDDDEVEYDILYCMAYFLNKEYAEAFDKELAEIAQAAGCKILNHEDW